MLIQVLSDDYAFGPKIHFLWTVVQCSFLDFGMINEKPTYSLTS